MCAHRAPDANRQQVPIGVELSDGHAALLPQKVRHTAIAALSRERIADGIDVTRAHAIERERWIDRQAFPGPRDPIAKEHVDRREDAVLQIDKRVCPRARPQDRRRPHREVVCVMERVLADAMQSGADLQAWRGEVHHMPVPRLLLVQRSDQLGHVGRETRRKHRVILEHQRVGGVGCQKSLHAREMTQRAGDLAAKEFAIQKADRTLEPILRKRLRGSSTPVDGRHSGE